MDLILYAPYLKILQESSVQVLFNLIMVAGSVLFFALTYLWINLQPPAVDCPTYLIRPSSLPAGTYNELPLTLFPVVVGGFQVF